MLNTSASVCVSILNRSKAKLVVGLVLGPGLTLLLEVILAVAWELGLC